MSDKSREQQLIDERKEKVQKLREKGVDPYPPEFSTTKKAQEINEEYESLKAEEKSGDTHRVAGRIVQKRDMGKVVFIDIKDEFDVVQLFMKEADTDGFSDIDLLDTGDFVGAEGEVFKTKTGETSIWVDSYDVLTKSIRPMPDKFHGLKDQELRYRKRYLDLAVNDEVKDVFKKRSLIVREVRNYLQQEGFLEVETPALQPIYGGGSAKPFKTYHNTLKRDLYLRIAPELYLKRLIIGGYRKVFEICKNFRNEGVDSSHNPEFTMLEAYQAYADYNDMMEVFEDIYETVAEKVIGTTTVTYGDHEIDLSTPWERKTMAEAIYEETGLDVLEEDESSLRKYVEEHSIPFEEEPAWGYYVQAIFEEECEDSIIQPTFIIDHPKETTPFCKTHRDDDRLVERFEPFCAGMEIGNAYTELNDPQLQRKHLEDQARQLEEGFEEKNPLDEDFLEAIEQGMPPTGGMGLGIDRMVMILLDQESIRDVILFPAMKEKDE